MLDQRPRLNTKTCSACSQEFACGPGEQKNCWCASYPSVIPLEDGKDCFCPSCFHQKMIAETQAYVEKAKLDPTLIDDLQRFSLNEALIEGIDYTTNEQGLMVLSAWYLLRRGYCCENNCQNCPYK